MIRLKDNENSSQDNQSDDSSRRDDWQAIGIILYQLISKGELPFQKIKEQYLRDTSIKPLELEGE